MSKILAFFFRLTRKSLTTTIYSNTPRPVIFQECCPDEIYKEWILRKKGEGCVALKEEDITPDDISAFQDYLFWKICEIAAEVSLPLQCHTGMGQIIDTNVLQLNNVIKNNPETKFVLLHCGFPWVDDILSMVDGYPNLYPDLTWVPILSYTASNRILHQLIEMAQGSQPLSCVVLSQ